MRERERLDHTVAAIARDRYGAGLAAAGWQYAARYEHRYIDAELRAQPIQRRPPIVLAAPPEPDELARAATAHLARLLALPDVPRLYQALVELTQLDAPCLTRDDGLEPAEVFASDERLNVVVIGAGPIGLALASALLVALGPAVNVLVIEDRIAAPHHKVPYSRRWLTAIGQDKLAGIVEEPLRILFGRIGTHFIGATINVLETLLMLSCRRLGARFRFADPTDLSVIGALPVHLVFDATGNRLHPPPEPTADTDVAIATRVETRTLVVSAELLASYAVDTLVTSPQPFIDVGVFGALHYPLFQGRRMRQAMLKVIRIPAHQCGPLVELLARRNQDNKFYVWRGSLRDEVNEGLVIINLTRAEYEALCATHVFPLAIADAVASPGLRGALDPRTLAVLERVALVAPVAELDAPLLWQPYFIENAGTAQLHGKPLLRVGDSIYNGNVKLANGMGPHLLHIAHVQAMIWGYATAGRAELVARTMGLAR